MDRRATRGSVRNDPAYWLPIPSPRCFPETHLTPPTGWRILALLCGIPDTTCAATLERVRCLSPQTGTGTLRMPDRESFLLFL